MAKIILHVDMDAFFTAVEEREHPEYKGKPVVVGADPMEGKGRGVVSTANYVAREFGVKSAVPISQAYKKCPDAIFLPVNYPLYEKVSARIMKILRKHADLLEVLGIDEAFLDVSKRAKTYAQAKNIAIRIKQDILAQEKLTCSVGVGPNRLIAKISSDMDKPNGLTIVEPRKVRSFLRPLGVRKLYGVGPKTEKLLNELGVKTVDDLEDLTKTELIDHFGKWGAGLYDMARGRASDEVVEHYEIKSMDREFTFQRDTKDATQLEYVIKKLSKELHERITKGGYFFKNVTLKIRLEHFQTFTRSRTLKIETQSVDTLIETELDLLKEFLNGKKVRLLGVRVAKLSKKGKQKTLV